MPWSSDSLMSPAPEMSHRADFTFSHYRELIRTAARHYTFRGFTDFSRDERFVLWRHDVDLSMQVARRQAAIEREEGVRATYFINPHSEYYNLLERSTADLVKAIIADGHDIGLHFDSHFHGIADESQLDAAIQQDAELIECSFGIRITTFSFHNTTPFTLGCRNWTYGGRINTYAEYFQSEVGYCSDSNGYWRHRRIADVLNEATDQRLQVLTHDGWWTDDITSPRSCVQQVLSQSAKSVFAQYQQHLAAHGMRDVGEIEQAWATLSLQNPELSRRAEWLYLDGYSELALLELWRALPLNARTVLGATQAGAAVSRAINLVIKNEELARGTLNAAIVSCIRSHATVVDLQVSAA